MCEACFAGSHQPTRFGRRSFVRRATQTPAPAVSMPAAIHPRSDWAQSDPTRPLELEEAVKYLVLHHSADTNSYGADAVPGLIRKWADVHRTEYSWPDLAYNFVVDRFGGVWEGRAGSIGGPVRGDGSMGDIGFSQSILLLGDHRGDPPSPEAMASLAALVGWMADRFALDLTPGAVASVASRGSERFAAGRAVELGVVSGHRDLISTACPGQACMNSINANFLGVADAARPSKLVPATTVPAPTTSQPVTTQAPTSAPTTTSSNADAGPVAAPSRRTTSAGRPQSGAGLLPVLGGGVVACAVATALVLRTRRSKDVAAAEAHHDESPAEPMSQLAPDIVSAIDMTGRVSIVEDDQFLASANSVVFGRCEHDEMAVDTVDRPGISVAVAASGPPGSAALSVNALAAGVRRLGDGLLMTDLPTLVHDLMNAARFQAHIRSRETRIPAEDLLAPDLAMVVAAGGFVAFVATGSGRVAASVRQADGEIVRRRFLGGESELAWPARSNVSGVAQLAVVPQSELIATVVAVGPSSEWASIDALAEIERVGELSDPEVPPLDDVVVAIAGLRSLSPNRERLTDSRENQTVG